MTTSPHPPRPHPPRPHPPRHHPPRPHPRSLAGTSLAGTVPDIHAPARVAGLDEALSFDELQLATRNHGLPLEALRYDVTPIGLHYLLVHYDIPAVDPAAWRLTDRRSRRRSPDARPGRHRAAAAAHRAGHHRVRRQRARPAASPAGQPAVAAGGGRHRRLDGHPAGRPARAGAAAGGRRVGGVHGRGPRLRAIRRAGLRQGAVGRGRDGRRTAARRRDERAAAPAAARRAAATGRARLVRHDARQMADPDHGAGRGVRRLPECGGVPAEAGRRRPGRPGDADPPARVDGAAGISGLHDARPRGGRRAARADRPGVVGQRARERVEVSTDAGGSWADAVLDPPIGRWAWRGWSYDWPAEPGETELCCRATDATGDVQPVDQPWNRQGMANTMVQRIPVVVRRP